MLAPGTDPSALAGLELVDRQGERIGRVRQVYPERGAPGWAGVRGNLIGTTEALVPLRDAQLEDGVLTLPITRARFLSAPRRTPDSAISDDERAELHRFYEHAPATAAVVAPVPMPVQAAEPEETPSDEPKPAEAADPAADAAPPIAETEVVRSEQRLHADTAAVPRTRVVLRTVVVTEQRTITVPVRREELRIVREPIEDGEPVADLPWAESEQELVLHEERVVVRTEVVPVERVRLVREVLQDQHEVTGRIWREQLVEGEQPR